MLRFLNIVAFVALLGSAVYAYTIKYQTSYRAEQIVKTKLEIKAERDAIAVLRAEWAYMTRPERLQQLADKYLPDLKQLQVAQLATAQSVPDKAARTDSIGQTLDALGLDPAATPSDTTQPPATTPRTTASATATSAAEPATTAKAPTAKAPAVSHERRKP
jgi:cell division protein FtsL